VEVYALAFNGMLDGPPGPSSLPRIVHYDGVDWRDVALTGTSSPYDIWNFGADDIWVTGDSLRHFDGAAWTEISTSVGALPVWGASPNDVWFGSGTTMYHWNGTEIAPVPSPPIDTLISIWGTSASDVWAGGGNPGLMHWDGALWSLVPTNSTLYVLGLWGSGPSDVWGVGNGGNRLHWDGTTVTASSEDYTGFESVTGTRADDIWGVGECCWDKGVYHAWMSHYDGSRWTDQQLPGLGEVTGVWVSPSGTYYAVADGTTVLRALPAGQTGGGSPDGGGSTACGTESTDLTTELGALVGDLQRDGGPCATVLDCQLFVPTLDCGDGYRLTGCPTLVADVDAARARVDALQTPGCDPIVADPGCRAQIFLDCPAPLARCQNGRCTSGP
jgi:hypothetical protein